MGQTDPVIVDRAQASVALPPTHRPPHVPPAAGNSPAIILAASAAALLNIALTYPGIVGNDAKNQYAEAVSGQLTDWHPPIMSWLWSLLLPIWDGPQPLLILQLVLHWGGFAILSLALARSRRPRAAWLMLAAGAFPVFPELNREILKDVGMGSTWIVAFALIFWFRTQNCSPGTWIKGLVILLLAYGTLVRTNAPFGLGPLLLYALLFPWRFRPGRLAVVSLFLGLLAIPLSSVLNHRVLGATSTHVSTALILYDLMGIAENSGNMAVLLPEVATTREELSGCYNVITLDTFMPWGTCGRIGRAFGVWVHGDEYVPEQPAGLTQRWIGAILSHPLAYLVHRVKHFNAEIFFIVPTQHGRWQQDHPSHGQTTTGVKRLLYLLARNPLIWPVSWIALGLSALALIWREPVSLNVTAAQVLLVSALGYSLPFLFVGVSTTLRYYYWPIMATMVALIIAYRELREILHASSSARAAVAVVLMGIVVIGMYARLTDAVIMM